MKSRIALILFFASISGAHADVVKWYVSGHVIGTFAYEPGHGPDLGAGLFQFTLTFDNAAADGDPSSTRGSFGDLVAVDISLNGQPFSVFSSAFHGSFIPDAQSALVVQNDALANGVFTDSLSFQASDSNTYGHELPWGDVPLNNFNLQLAHQGNAPSALLASDGIPSNLPDLQQFEIRSMQLSGVYSTTDLYWFDLSVDSLAPVPIPAAAWMLLSGLGLLGVTRGVTRGRARAAMATC